MGLLARRAKVVEPAWVRVAREAVGPEGQVVPQQWHPHTTAPGGAATGPPTPGPRRLWGYNSRWGALLRRDPGVPSHKDGSPSALRRPS